MQKGTTQTITATIKPTNATNKNVSWTSGNTSIATVTGSGLTATITAVAAGSTNITVTTQDGGKTATCNVTVLETGEISQVGTTTWNSSTHTASITIKTTAVGYTFEYQKNSNTGTWTTISGSQTTISNLSNGDTIYARIRYGSEITNASFDIQDREVPDNATINLSAEKTTPGESITATVTHTDNQSGVNATSCKYIYNTTSTNIGTTSSLWSSASTFTSNPQTITLNADTSGTYYLHVLTVDNAGNKKEATSNAVTVKEVIKVGEQAPFTGTIDGGDPSSTNPTIPAGYIPTDTSTSSWGDGSAPPTTANINKGLVIKDVSGNEWVWIPVSNVSTLYTSGTTSLTTETSVKTTYYSKSEIISGQTRGKPGETSLIPREPDLVTGSGTSYDYSNYSTAGFSSLNDMATKIVADYKQMIDSIAKYKGFYIGRYELTQNGTKAGTPITNASWYTLYPNCKSLSASEAAVTRMIWGCQWDVTCNWLADNGYNITDSRTWGNHRDSTGNAAVSGYGSKQNTGYSEYWKANNIYDFAGNCLEWTQEGWYASYRVCRGGSGYGSGSTYPASSRYNGDLPPDDYDIGVSSRPTLIVTP